MRTATERLPSDREKLHHMVLELRAKLAEKDSRINALEQQYHTLLEQFRLAQHRQFGQSSEVSSEQLGLFNEAEQALEAEAEPAATATETRTITRNKPRRKPLPEDLPREQVIHDIAAADKICSCCGHGLHRMGEETSEQLAFIPASIKVIEHIRPKYSCRHCERQGTEVAIKMAPVPASPIPKSIATPSLLAQVISSKYQYALPLYRQEQMFRQFEIDLSRKTLAAWIIRCSELLTPIYRRLKKIQLQQTVIQADETPLKVIHQEKSRCYMWVYCTGADSPKGKQPNPLPNIVLYDYQSSRSGSCVKAWLDGYSHYLQVDGYVGYEQTDAILVGCMAHARRKFIEAQKTQVKGKTGKADWAINHIRKLYRIETEIKDLSPQDRQQQREERARPLLEQFKAWLDKSINQVPPKSAIGKAIAYSLGQWDKLIRYIEDGDLQIDNNRVERAVKPFVIGRKNWLFSNTENGAQASAILYSIVETARANAIIGYDYLRLLLEELAKNPDAIDHLLPWVVDLPRQVNK